MCEVKQDDRFVIDEPSKADWALMKLSEIRKQMDEIKKRAEIQEQRIFDWKTAELNKLAENEEYFKSLLDEFMNANLAEDPKFKFSSPYGKISTRRSKKWTYNDDALIDEYKDTDLVKKMLKLDKNALKKRIEVVDGKVIDTETGQLVEGVSVEEKQKITIKTEE